MQQLFIELERGDASLLRNIKGHCTGAALQEALPRRRRWPKHLDMHRTFIGRLETGRGDFRLRTPIRVTEALDVELADLFKERGSPCRKRNEMPVPTSRGCARSRRWKMPSNG